MPSAPSPLPAAKTESPPPKTEPLPPPPTIAPTTPSPEAETVIPTPPPVQPPPARPPRKNAQRPPAGQTAPAGQPAQSGQPSGPSQPAPTTPAPAPAPQLAIVLTPEQQRQYNSDIDQSIQRAEGNLRSLANRQLSNEQKASMEEARNFVRQAQAARTSDLPAAKRLAERADVLAANLANSFK